MVCFLFVEKELLGIHFDIEYLSEWSMKKNQCQDFVCINETHLKQWQIRVVQLFLSERGRTGFSNRIELLEFVPGTGLYHTSIRHKKELFEVDNIIDESPLKQKKNDSQYDWQLNEGKKFRNAKRFTRTNKYRVSFSFVYREKNEIRVEFKQKINLTSIFIHLFKLEKKNLLRITMIVGSKGKHRNRIKICQ